MCSRRRNAPSVPASLQRSASASNRRFSLPENWRRLAIATTSGSRRAPSPEAISPVALPAPSATASEEEPDNPFREDFTNEVMFMSTCTLNCPRQVSHLTLARGGVGRIGSVDKLEEFDEFAAAMAIPDQGMDLAGKQVDAGKQADCAVALIFMIAREGRVQAGLGRQVRSRRGDRLDTGLFVIGNDRHCIAWLLLRCRRGLLNDLHLAVDAQNLRHLGFEFGIAAFQVIADLMRLHLLAR